MQSRSNLMVKCCCIKNIKDLGRAGGYVTTLSVYLNSSYDTLTWCLNVVQFTLDLCTHATTAIVYYMHSFWYEFICFFQLGLEMALGKMGSQTVSGFKCSIHNSAGWLISTPLMDSESEGFLTIQRNRVRLQDRGHQCGYGDKKKQQQKGWVREKPCQCL